MVTKTLSSAALIRRVFFPPGSPVTTHPCTRGRRTTCTRAIQGTSSIPSTPSCTGLKGVGIITLTLIERERAEEEEEVVEEEDVF